jgi:hypothetical protein
MFFPGMLASNVNNLLQVYFASKVIPLKTISTNFATAASPIFPRTAWHYFALSARRAQRKVNLGMTLQVGERDLFSFL